jgi:hypothetical protein
MAYTSGTAANYKDLLAIMTTFAAANGWSILEQTAEKVFLKGSGSAGLDEIYCGVSTYEDTGNSYYNWELHGAWGFRAGRDYSAMPRSAGDDVAFSYLWNNAIPYWMVCNGRRIIVVAKVGTNYMHAHLGLLTPPATEEQYPYPMLLGGCGTTKGRSYSNTNNSAYWNCTNANGSIAGKICRPGGVWNNVGGATTSPDVDLLLCQSYEDLSNIIASPNGEYLLEPVVALHRSDPNIYGVVEGLYRVSGYQNAAENILTLAGKNHMVFPDCHRSTYGDYCALRMD